MSCRILAAVAKLEVCDLLAIHAAGIVLDFICDVPGRSTAFMAVWWETNEHACRRRDGNRLHWASTRKSDQCNSD